ncbi:hypothetical protein WOLCODRAFT_165104 [Wolfiporia cocos MD-104 SS10]|uniref:Uncharacterized protein n=1 Tax=Wolfiporia cocos (strain MD-104) TaxID=742152 RepID=A0A2H3JR30_WOLCO|nr:hypothetical protein WOLCODRAFT_165104 [Wolfiporia cocos MD-104 SS10]
MSTAIAISNADDPFDPLALHPDRPPSIDFNLDLEHQLESESIPCSPTDTEERPQSLDTNVLASIVTQLRLSLETVSKERDSLSEQLSEAKYREENLREALHTVSEKCHRTEAELATARDQHQDDEDAIAMLRQKVEESRRALMRLQTESRRMSQMSNLTLDLSRAGPHSPNGASSSRRASAFSPLTGTSAGLMGHRRISSFSDPGSTENGLQPTSPLTGDPRPVPAPANGHSKRISGLFGRGTPAVPEMLTIDAAELAGLRKELDVVKEQLEETKHELSEAQEAKEASELCVCALRTFIAENSVGEHAARNNARPTKSAPAAPPAQPPANTSRWSFKLWTTSDSPVSAPPPPPAATASAPVARKLGGLFSPRSSISSNACSVPPAVPPASHESSYMGSDTSSVADSSNEPVSPVSSKPRASVLVQDAERMSFAEESVPESAKLVAIAV